VPASLVTAFRDVPLKGKWSCHGGTEVHPPRRFPDGGEDARHARSRNSYCLGLSPAPQLDPQALGFGSGALGLSPAPQLDPQALGFGSGALGLSPAPQLEPHDPPVLAEMPVLR